MNFYTNAFLEGNHVLYRGIVAGKRIQKKIPYEPKLYVKSPAGTWRTLKGISLEEKSFPSIYAARDFIKKHDQLDNFKIYGQRRFDYALLGDMFEGDMEWDTSKIIVAYIDIEVGSSNGFPNPESAAEPITAITINVLGKYIVFGCGEYETTRTDVKYYNCVDEIDLIKQFLTVWAGLRPDIITGWNVNLFDMPYVINRTTKLLGEDWASMVSPWKSLRLESQRIGFKDRQVYTIAGVAILDYQDLYKKFAPTPNQESYALGNIALVELDEKKLDYSEYGSLNDLYVKNFQKYIEYNIQDVELVVRLENKLKLIELAMTLAYTAKVNFQDVFFQVRMWDSISYNKLKKRKIALPPKEDRAKTESFTGAYVKDPQTGLHKWVVSFDLTSLYPHLIMMYNLSPEMLIEPTDYTDEMNAFFRKNAGNVNLEAILEKKLDLDWMKEFDITLSPNGHLFKTDRAGFLPELMESMFEGRALNKKKMLVAKTKLEQATDPTERKDLSNQVAKFSALQMAQKVSLNSAYGVVGSPYFRFFDVRIAEAITMGGQLAIRWIQAALNKFLNKNLKTVNVDYVIASDTDSVYLSLDKLIESIAPNEKDPVVVIELMNNICEKKLKPFIDTSYQELASYVNAREQKMVMKREALCDRAIWTAKKRYVLNVYNNEGIQYKEPQLKIVGMEAIKSSTPVAIRKKIKETIKLILSGTEDDVIVFADKYRSEFKRLPIVDIAFPRGVNGLKKYQSSRDIWASGTPVHTKGALVFNHYIKHLGLQKKYETIKEGEKIRFIYLKEPNPLQATVLSFIGSIPAEFELDNYIDYDLMFAKTYSDPVKSVLTAIGWELERTATLEDYF